MTQDQWSQQPERPPWAQGLDGLNVQAPDLHLTFDVGPHDVSSALWTRAVIGYGYAHARTLTWATSCPADDLRALPGVTFLAAYSNNSEGLLEYDDAVIRLRLGDGRAAAWIAARTAEAVADHAATLKEALPPAVEDPEEPRIAVTFWSLGEHGPTQRTRTIDVPPWEQIAPHYVEMTGQHLDGMMGADFEPGAGGQLFLWNGPPGTGKTYALRALGWEWRTWCDLHYIADPETFFGERASYMLDVLLASDDEAPAIGPIDDDDAPPSPPVDPRAKDGRWRLLVLEDTGELMSADARERSGQGLSRLLNVVDGLIGQGLRLLVLVTTNEQLRKLHPAVSRPGRCAEHVEFAAFPTDEAAAWLARYGVEPMDFDGAVTLADLFAHRHDRAPVTSAARVGF